MIENIIIIIIKENITDYEKNLLLINGWENGFKIKRFNNELFYLSNRILFKKTDVPSFDYLSNEFLTKIILLKSCLNDIEIYCERNHVIKML